ncbi:MAG: carbohydrate-binding family 9-like protein [Planctomycetota bacterium]|jgi:hypothetical protein
MRNRVGLLVMGMLVMVVLGCEKRASEVKSDDKGDRMYKKYEVLKTNAPAKLDGGWDGEIWSKAKLLDINNWMGDEPQHKPETQAKVLYDEEFIYVIFRVEDKYIKAVAQKYHDPVCRDSCVEFFFTPGEDISKGYFNIEINCGGTMLLYHQISRSEGRVAVSEADCDKIEIYHSEPKIIEPEKQEPTTWFVEYKVPLAMLKKYMKVIMPNTDVKWKANFYKCADKTSHPHWLTWSVVDLPKPDFHRPEFFGTLEFK